MKSTQAKHSRRNFLIAVGAGAGAAATAAAVAGKVVSAPQPAAADRGKGYEETAHVRNYYRTTQV